MGLFSFAKKSESAVLIDIQSDSVGGAYAYFREGERPALYYSIRTDIQTKEGESHTDAMLRTLSEVERALVLEGAPSLRREVGSGHADRVLVSVAAPWQETRVMTKHIQQQRPFLVTHALLASAATEIADTAPDRIESGRSIIATLLNGYETGNPYGKHARRADLVILSSTLEKEAGEAIQKSLRHAFHAHDIRLTAFSPAVYAVFRDLYPHQKDFIILEVSGSTTDASFVKHGLLSGVRSIPHGIDELVRTSLRAAHASGARTQAGLLNRDRNEDFEAGSDAAEKAWLQSLHEVFAEFAALQALPRTLFLLAADDSRDFLKRMLEAGDYRTLWLTDEPLAIRQISQENLATRIQVRGQATGDFALSLLALFYGKDTKAASPEKPEISAETDDIFPSSGPVQA